MLAKIADIRAMKAADMRVRVENALDALSAEAQAIDAAVVAEIDGAVAFAEAGTLEPVESLEQFVLMDRVVQEAAT